MEKEKIFKLPKLDFGNGLFAKNPIVQGGMAIKVSTAKLAAAVANCGGVGIIGASGLTEEELRSQIRLARSLQKNHDGLIGVNIMFAAREFSMLARVSMEEGIDIIFFGAGFSRDIFEEGRKHHTPIVPIVSSPKLAALSQKLGASAVVLESGDAGGHLGTDKSLEELLPEVRKALDESAPEGKHAIPLIAAGGIANGFDIAKFLKMGADGVQMGTRFLLSDECEASDKFKKMLVSAKESDIVKILSPVGLQARAIVSNFTKKLLENKAPKPQHCDRCLKHCSGSFCIMKALNLSCSGDVENGLFFTGKSLLNIHEILPVKEIFKGLVREIRANF